MLLCPFYGSARGCKWSEKCWDDHSDPNSVPFCTDYNSPNGCPYGDDCYFRHQQYVLIPRTPPSHSQVTTQMELENALKVSISTESTESIPFQSPQNEHSEYPLPEIQQIHPVSIPLSYVPNHNETACQCQITRIVHRDAHEPEYEVSAAAPSTIIQTATDRDTVCNDSTEPLDDRCGPKLVDAAEAESILDPVTNHDDEPLASDLSPRSVLEKGTKCLLCDLLFSSSMNGALCKVVGSYREDEDRYPVYVYKTKETALIKAGNLKAIKTKSKSKKKKKSKMTLPLTVHRMFCLLMHCNDRYFCVPLGVQNRRR